MDADDANPAQAHGQTTDMSERRARQVCAILLYTGLLVP